MIIFINTARLFGFFATVFSICVAPFIHFAPKGLFSYLQFATGCYSAPILSALFMSFTFDKISDHAMNYSIILSVLFYLVINLMLSIDLHYLHILFITFLFCVCSTYLLNYIFLGTFLCKKTSYKQFGEPWKYRYVFSSCLVFLLLAIYILFSPLQNKENYIIFLSFLF